MACPVSNYQRRKIPSRSTSFPNTCYRWTSGATWPGSGEIDIMEAVNENKAAEFTIHTGPGCTVADGVFSGKMTTSNCDVAAEGQLPNVGCNIVGDDSASFGTGFNSGGGGVYAMEWTSDAISMWFFPRGKIPTDIDGSNPDPTSWSKPMAQFKGACDIDQAIQDQHIVSSSSAVFFFLSSLGSTLILFPTGFGHVFLR